MSTPLPIVERRNPHFERLGGRPAVARLVDAFYVAMDTREDARTIRAMHASDLADTRRVLVDYLCEWLGGPKDYTAARGAPKLRRRHAHVALDEAARDAWLGCMRDALALACEDAALRDELLASFAKVADFLRNTP